ncbi:hypothetical protein GCM10010430_02120 [Kitasatospora cystarginea]|uniref:TnsA-like heteromeric transposase endonuclease subunit n=1 Tax=Kitasatospora cystarginea TaxID=58350 RepID=A0ABN3DBF8_9ACTN
MPGSAVAAARGADELFEVEYVDRHGRLVRADLLDCWRYPFEDSRPSRSFPVYRGQKNFSGWWWTATTGGHVGYESWLERSSLIELDFDPAVVGIASQPMWLHWPQGGKRRRHAPDYFVRKADGTGVLVDVRAHDRVKPEDADTFAAAGRACAQVGWHFLHLGVPAGIRAANLRWLAGYRHPRNWRPETSGLLWEAFAEPRPLFQGADVVGSRIAVLPVLFHLMWRRMLVADLDCSLLGPETVVHAGEAIADE